MLYPVCWACFEGACFILSAGHALSVLVIMGDSCFASFDIG